MKLGEPLITNQKATLLQKLSGFWSTISSNSSSNLVLQALLLGCVYAVLSTPAAYTSNGNTLAAIIWPAPPIASALLWRLPYRQWGIFLLAVFAAMLFVGDLDELSFGADTAFAALNVFQVALYSLVGKRFVSERGEIDTSHKLARFMFFLPLLTTSVVASLGAAIGVLTKHTLWFDEWRVMMVGNGLAVLVLLPALLAWCPTDRLEPMRKAAGSARWTSTIAAVMAALLLLSSTLLQSFPAEVLRALLSLVLVWAAIHGGLRATSVGMLVAAIAGIGLTFMRLGPYALPHNGIWALQLDLAGLALLSFFVAIAVHERESLNLRLDRARRFESMGLLAGGIAHDFNNILGAVGGYTELANEQLGADGVAQASLREVSMAVARGKDLTAQILHAGGPSKNTRETIDLRNIVTQSVGLVRPLLPSHVKMTLRMPATSVPVFAHQSQLLRAMLNLMRNASQAAVSTVSVTLSFGHISAAKMASADHLVGEVLHESCVWADVTDDGCGIPVAHIHKIFDPFFSSRAFSGAKTSKQNQGTGLGLPIVAGVATDHAGGVAVWSGHGAATRFRLMLPLVPAKMQTSVRIARTKPGQGQSVLLLEKDAMQRERHEDFLAVLGFEPVGYGHEDEALAALEQSPEAFALLITDLQLTDTKQNELRQKICRLAPALPIICRAAHSDTTVITQNADLVTLPASFDCDALHVAVTMAIGTACLPGLRYPLA